jgi:hypothetical protein
MDMANLRIGIASGRDERPQVTPADAREGRLPSGLYATGAAA